MSGDEINRCSAWRLRTKYLEFGQLPLLMGIVNVTPDSFSDGGSYLQTSQAIEQALRLEDAGAAIVDIGGESTRPYADPVDGREELRRIAPVLEGLQGRLSIPISIDTTKAVVAEVAIELGAEIVNDVSGLTADAEMIPQVVQKQVAVCAMHMQGTPQTMQDAPSYSDVVDEIKSYLIQRKETLVAAGIDARRICLDPGIGFGKTHEHNGQLVRRVAEFLSIGQPVLVGHSRKGFISKWMGNKDRDRTCATVGVSLALAKAGVQLLRVHDVAATRDALVCFAAAGGLEG
jgi:dihydropteroate synthase